MKKFRLPELILLLLSLLLVLVWLAYFSFRISDAKIYFFDVGQGDSSLIIGPNNYQILIDGGPNNLVLEKLGKAMPFYDHEIELLIVSHPHADHLTGLIQVAQNYKISKIWQTKFDLNDEQTKAWQAVIDQKHIAVENPTVGEMKYLGGVKIINLGPFSQLDNQFDTNPNNDSMVIKASFAGKNILFPGDAELEEQKILTDSDIDLTSDILKQPHHGSEKFSTDFLNKIQPQDVVISDGKNNNYGFPNPNTLEKLKNEKVFRTDLSGTIEAVIKNTGSLEISPVSL